MLPPNEWHSRLLPNKDGAPKKSIANTITILTMHPAFEGVLVLDEFRQAIVKMKPPPVRSQDGGSSLGEWTESDTTRTAAWMASEIGFEPALTMIENAIEAAAERNRVHPVRDYLRAQPWDGVSRLDEMLTTYFGAVSSEYTRAVGSRWMISAVARIMKPGCQVDCMLVLEGQQGSGKSTGARALASDEWFADTGIRIGDKDSYQALRAKWIYEFGELDSIKGRESTRVKSFVSSQIDNYRPSYGRRNRDFPRQCVFIGTTNESEYLIDQSGNRRYWPVKCGVRVDVAGLRRDRDQLWAEARVRYERGQPWHANTAALRALLDAEQRERQVGDPWLPMVESYLKPPITVSSPIGGFDAGGNARERILENEGEGVTTRDVMLFGLNLRPNQMDRAAETRVGHLLRELGWEPRQMREQGGRVRRYFDASPNRLNSVASSSGGSGDAKAPVFEGPDTPVTTVTTTLGEYMKSLKRDDGGQSSNSGDALFCGRDGRDGQSPLDRLQHQKRYQIGTVVRGDDERRALAQHLVTHPAELARLSSDAANDNGRPARPHGPVMMAGDLARWYRDHPEALEQDARLKSA